MSETKKTIERIFKDILAVDIVFEDHTSSADIHSWDSLNHIVLMNAIEEKFNIKFDLDEMLSMLNFGDICSAVDRKIAA